jgi:multiple sugar transport system substrate-binding protein
VKKIICLLGVALLILTSCGKQETEKNTQKVLSKQKSAVQSSDDSTINVVITSDVQSLKWFKLIKNGYEKAYPKRKVNLQMISGTPQNYYTKIQLMLKSDTSIDVVKEDSFMLHSDINAGLFAPIEGINKWKEWDEFYPNLREFATYNGKVYGVSMTTDTRGLFYNTDIFKKAGIEVPWQPKTWQDIIDACQKIKKNVPDVSPIALTVSQAMGEGTTMQTLEMLLYGTDNPLYKDGKWMLSSPGMLNSFKFIQTLAENNYLPRPGILMNPQYGNIIPTELAPKGEVAIILDGCWITGRWANDYPETLKKYKLAKMPTEFGQKPGYISMSGGWLLSVNSKSRKKDAAFDFIKFALNKENILSNVLTVNNLSVRKDVTNDPKYPAFLKPATDILKYTHFRPANSQYPIVSSKLQFAVESVATQTATPEQAVKRLVSSVKRALGKEVVLEKNIK